MADSTSPGDIANPRRRVSAAIGSATSLSSAVDLHGYRLAAIDFASGATAAFSLTFAVSPDGSSFFDLRSATGEEVAIASGALTTADKRSVVFDANLSQYLSAHRYVKVRAGPASAPITLGATAQPFDMILLPIR